MYTCKNCGTAFEGKFCPECGTRREDAVCPQCGTVLGEGIKFCPGCGYRVVPPQPQATETVNPASVHNQEAAVVDAAPAQNQGVGGQGYAAPRQNYPLQQSYVPHYHAPATEAKERKSSLGKLYGWLAVIPAVLFTALSVMLFLFFIGDVGSLSFFGMSEGTGSLYTLLGNMDDADGMGGTVAALLAVAIISFIFGLVYIILAFKPTMRVPTKKIGKFNVCKITFLTYASFVLYFLLFLLACILAGQVGRLGLKAGAAPVCTLVFALVFGLLSGGCLIARFILAKKSPAIAADEAEKFELRSKAEADKKAAANQAVNATQTANSGIGMASVATSALYSPQESQKIIKNIKVLTKHYSAATMLVFAILFMPIGLIGMLVALGKKIWDWNPSNLLKEKKGLITRAVICAIFGIIYFAYGIFMATFMPKLIGGMGDKVLNTVFNLVGAYACSCGILLLAGMVLAITALPAVGKLCKYFYGKDNPNMVIDEPIYDMRKLATAEEMRKANPASVKKAGVAAVLVSVVCVTLAAIIAVFCIFAIPKEAKIFKASVVEQIEIGDAKYEVTGILGESDETASAANYFVYLSGNVKSLQKQISDLEKESEKAFEKGDLKKLAEIEKKYESIYAKIAKLHYKSIGVMFDNNEEVTSVELNMDACEVSESLFKTVKEVKLSKTKLPMYPGSEDKELYAQIYFTDGSYKLYQVPAYAFGDVDFSVIGTHRISWNDDWCNNEVTANITVDASLESSATIVNFETNGGSSVNFVQLENGNTQLTELPVPTRTDYYFAGWYADSALTDYVELPYRVYNSKKLYAKWVDISDLTIELTNSKFENVNGYLTAYDEDVYSVTSFTITADRRVKLSYYYEMKTSSSNDLTVVKHTAIGSTKLTDASGSSYNNTPKEVVLRQGEYLTVTYDCNSSSYNDGYASFKLVSAEQDNSGYDISFETNGGSNVSTLRDKEFATLPTPTRTGYYFAGWYTDSSLTNAITLPFTPTQNGTLYAKWVAITGLTITNNSTSPFVNRNGVMTSTNKTHSSSSTYTLTATSGIKVNFSYSVSSESDDYFTIVKHTESGTTQQIARRSGNYSFSTLETLLSSGDYITFTYSKDSSGSSGKDEAYFKINSVTDGYTLSFNTNGGSTISSQKMVTFETLPTPTRSGYYFAGWYSDSSLTNAVTLPYTPAQNETLYAKWTAVQGITVTNNSTSPFVNVNGVMTSTNKAHSSSSTYRLTATSNVKVSFDYQVSSETQYDKFTITKYSSNGSSSKQIAQISGTGSSSYNNTALLAAGEYITFVYSKDNSNSNGNDEAYFRLNSVTAPTTSTGYTITNNSSYSYSLSNGVYTSTNKNNSSSSTLKITANTSMILSFEYNVSSEVDDKFTITKYSSNGSSSTQIDQISGTSSSYKSKSISLLAGEYIEFVYNKDSAQSGGSDCGYVRNISAVA